MKTLNIKKLENLLGISFSNENLLPVNVSIKFWGDDCYQIQIFNTEKVESFFIYINDFRNHNDIAQYIENRAIWIICRVFITDSLCKDEMTNFRILYKIDSYFAEQWRNSSEYAYLSEINGNKLTISDFSGNKIDFEVTSNTVKISNLIGSFTIDRLDFWFKNDFREKHFWEFLNQQAIAIANSTNITFDFINLMREPKSYKTNLTSLTAKQVRRLGVIPKRSVYYFNGRFVGHFYASSKNLVRKINNRLGI